MPWLKRKPFDPLCACSAPPPLLGTESEKQGVAGLGARRMGWERTTSASIFSAAALVSVALVLRATYFFARIPIFGGWPELILGSLLCGWIVFLVYRIVGYMAGAARAFRGAVAEETVGRILDTFPPDWITTHDINTGTGNIDHILVSSKGIFVLETKSHVGHITASNGVLLRSGMKFEKNFLEQVTRLAHRVRQTVGYAGLGTIPVIPVVVFAHPHTHVNVPRPVKEVHVLAARDLKPFVEGLPNRVYWQQIQRAGNVIRSRGTKDMQMSMSVPPVDHRGVL